MFFKNNKKLISWSGFTIVEILVVVIVIGILATIVVGASNGYFRNQADSAAQVSLEDASRKLDGYKLKNGEYSDNALLAYSNQEGVQVTSEGINPTGYCLKAASVRYADIAYYVNNKGEVSTTDCSLPPEPLPDPSDPPADPPPPVDPPPAPSGIASACDNNSYYSGTDGFGIWRQAYEGGNNGNDPIYKELWICATPGDSVTGTVKCNTTHRGNTAQGGYPSTDSVFQGTPDISGDTYTANIGTVTIPENHEKYISIDPSPSWGPSDKANNGLVCQFYAYDNTQHKAIPNTSGSNTRDRFYNFFN